MSRLPDVFSLPLKVDLESSLLTVGLATQEDGSHTRGGWLEITAENGNIIPEVLLCENCTS